MPQDAEPVPVQLDHRTRTLPARIWRWARLIIVLAMIVGLVIIAKPVRLIETISHTNVLWLLAAVPLTAIAVALDAVRLHLLLTPVGFRRGWWPVAVTTTVVNFVSLFLPGTIGGGAVAWLRLSGKNLRAQVFVALSLNTIIKIVVVCGAGALALAIDVQALPAHRAFIIPLAVIAVAPILILIAMLRTGLAASFRQFSVNKLSPILPARVLDALRKSLESLETYNPFLGNVLAAVAVGFCRILVTAAYTLCALYAVGLFDVGFIRILWIVCASEATGMIPFSLAGWGLPQVTYVGLLSAFAIPADVALASNIVHWIAWLPLLLAGAAAMLHESWVAKKSDRSHP